MSFVFLLAYLVCTFIRPQEWVLFFYNQQLIFIFSLATLISLIAERFFTKKKIFARIPQNYFIFCLLLSVVLSHLSNGYFGGIIESLGLFYVNIVLYLIILNSLNSEKKIKIALWTMIILILLLAIQGIFQYENGVGWAGQEILNQSTYQIDERTGEQLLLEDKRITWIGIFSDPNDLALTFVIAVGLLLSFVFGKSKIITRLFSSIALGTLIYGIYLTNSRGGFIALGATLFYYFVKRTRKFLIGGIIGFAVVIIVFSFGPSRMALLNVEEESANTRIELWYEGLKMLESRPFFGVGYGMFTDQLPQTAHNSYVLAASELGFFGLFCYVALFYYSFRALSFAQLVYSPLATYSIGLQSALLGFACASFFLSRTYVILPYILFAYSGALYYFSVKRAKKTVYLITSKDIAIIFGLCLGLLVFVLILTKVGLN